MNFVGKDLKLNGVDVETVTGAQAKATTAEVNAKNYSEKKQYQGQYVKLASDLPLTYPKQQMTHHFGRGTDGWPFSYCGIVTYAMHTNEAMIQYAYEYQNGRNPNGSIKVRMASYASNVWGAWFDPETTEGAQSKANQAEVNAKAAIPTKMSELENDIGAGGGIKITTSPTAPTGTSPGDLWYKEV